MQEDFYMRRFIVLLIFITHISSVMANTINSSPYFSKYPSKLKTYNTSTSTNRYYNPQRLYRANQYQQKVYNRHCPHCHHQNYYHQPIKINNLKRLEKHVWGKSYSSDDDITRLERLENLAFGAIQEGDLSSRYSNIESAILSRPAYKTKASILGTIGNYLAGQATGFTPNITTQELNGYDNFAPFGGDYFVSPPHSLSGYSNNMVEKYSNGLFGGGWGSFNNNVSSGSGITILP